VPPQPARNVAIAAASAIRLADRFKARLEIKPIGIPLA